MTNILRRSLHLASLRRSASGPASALRPASWRPALPSGRYYSGPLLSSRSLSFSAVPRFAFRALGRLGVAGGVGAGALAYANHKVDGFRQSMADTFGGAAEWGAHAAQQASSGLTSAWNSASGAVSSGADGVRGWGASMRTWLASRAAEEEPDEGAYEEFGEGDGKPDPDGKRTAAALALSAGTVMLSPDDQGDPANDLMLLTKKLIEIRSILLSIDHAESLQLPSIVVIGSQSSGKSSVLESVVGHEFLPKGNNMVTRRPIELTLIHTPRTSKNPHPQEFAEFPTEPGSGVITDFAQVQKRLTDLNLSVPAEEAVSPVPIQLRIHSPNVPDLSLVDLPGYVQLASMDQPDQLREKIQSLCDKYIRANNIILAVCAADVDLANSPALRASRKVDPLGMRTIGVITKMDLVDPAIGAGILANDRYPLALGYVGVVCKATGKNHEDSQRLFNFGSASPNTDLLKPVARHERAFFGEHAELFSQPGMLIGTSTLKRRLMTVLESAMSSSLSSISDAVASELEEASYQFKVQYNDRSISAESYAAETMDLLKAKMADMSKQYTKPQARAVLRQEVDMIVLDTLAGLYWGDVKLPDLAKLATETKKVPDAEALDDYWHHKLEAATSALSKSGIGRMSANMFVQQLKERVEAIAAAEPFIFHPSTQQRISALTDAILQQRLALTSSQVENSIKPLKRDPEVDARQWDEGRTASVKLLEEDLRQCQDTYNRISDMVGGRKLRRAIAYVKDLEEKERAKQSRVLNARLEGKPLELEEDEHDPNRPAYNPNLLVKAREASFLVQRSDVLKARVYALNHKRCKAGPENAAFCPEAFLEAVASQLTHTAIQHINMELLGEFFYQFPREIDTRTDLDREETARFARENPSIKRHLDLQDRKEKLELVREKLDSLVKLQADKEGDEFGRSSSRRGPRRGLFGLF